MRYAILSDIHGNLPALEAVLADMSLLREDEVILAGDLLGPGPDPYGTLQRLRSLGARAIRGNNERYLVDMQTGACPAGMLNSRQFAPTRWAWEHLGTEAMDWVNALPRELSLDVPGGGIRVVHGSPRSDSEGLVPDRDPAALAHFRYASILGPLQTTRPLSEAVDGLAERVLVCGHTHIPWQQREGDRLCLNPGSVGAPINRDPRAQYAILENLGNDWRVEFRALPYDIRAVRVAMERSGLLEAGGGFARAMLLDFERADNTVWRFVRHCLDFAAQAGVDPAQVIPDPLWTEAERSFDWNS